MPTMASTPPADDFVFIKARLVGQVMHVPDLKPFFARWQASLSPHYSELVTIVNDRIDAWISDPRVREKVRRIDLALFAAIWYPMASLERLQTIAFFTLWLFIWDDDLDGAGNGLADILAHTTTSELQERVLRYVKFHLGLAAPSHSHSHSRSHAVAADGQARNQVHEHGQGQCQGSGGTICLNHADASSSESGSDDEDTTRRAEPRPPTAYCGIVAGTARDLQAGYTETQARRFVAELLFYMQACEAEQATVASGVMPGVEGYMRERLGTSSLFVYCALSEYMSGTNVPDELFEKREMKTMWREVNRNVVIVNDMLSLKKEMKSSVYSLIPVLMNQTGRDLQTIITNLVHELDASIRKFDHARDSLLRQVKRSYGLEVVYGEVCKYTRALETSMVGNLYWALSSDRYGMTKYINKDGSLDVPL